jgi:hypothetical protein
VTYDVYEYQGRKVLAIPRTTAHIYRAGIRCLEPSTVSKLAYRLYLYAVKATKTSGMSSTQTTAPIPETIETALRDGLARLGERLGPHAELHVVVGWPPQRQRPRLYFHILDENGQQACFIKAALDREDAQYLTREYETLSKLEHAGPFAIQIPKVLDIWRDAHMFLAISPLGAASRTRRISARYPAHAVRDFQGVPIDVPCAEIGQLTWRPGHSTVLSDAKEFNNELLNEVKPWTVGRVHGDFGRHNVRLSTNGIWVYDWEMSAEDGPILTDHVGWELTKLRGRIQAEPHNWRELVDHYVPALTKLPRHQLAQAIAFRAAGGFLDAISIARYWSQSEGWGR